MSTVVHEPPVRPPALEVTGLTKHFPIGFRLFGDSGDVVRAVDGISFAIRPGETLGVVGESGCGKSTTAKLVLKLEEPTEGTIKFNGNELSTLGREALKAYRRSVQAVFQDPFASLNPRMRVGAIIGEPVITHEKLPRAEVRRRVEELLDLVSLPRRSADLFPHEFSGGQRQRIAIARALSLSPSLIVLDEPVSALDVSIRAQILNLLQDLQRRTGVSYLFITHDLAAVAHVSHDIAVMYLGKIVEIGSAAAIASDPKHPYTRALFAAALPEHPDDVGGVALVRGEVPSPIAPPSGCHFHPRCPFAMPQCSSIAPRLGSIGDREIACHLFPAAERAGVDATAPQATYQKAASSLPRSEPAPMVTSGGPSARRPAESRVSRVLGA